MTRSVFSQLPVSSHVASNGLAFAIRDGYPVTEGHTLVITRREVADWFSASPAEQAAVMELVETVKAQLDEELKPDGYNVGFNAGAAAGQTVMHLHVHVIPRYDGDTPNPRGGVRHVIPERGNYTPEAPWPATERPEARKAALTTGRKDPLLAALRPLLRDAREVDIVAAFVRSTGVKTVIPFLEPVLARGGQVRVLTGDYQLLTQPAALQALQALDGNIEVRAIQVGTTSGHRSFHPKAWRVVGDDYAVGFVGSSNLSEVALNDGTEWNLFVDRDRDPKAFDDLKRAFTVAWGEAQDVDTAWLLSYAERVRQAPRWQLARGAWVRPQPRELQQMALDALAAGRAEGRTRALVVMATGLGKTLLAVFDALRMIEAWGGGRVLVLAHRRELLEQAVVAFQKVDPPLIAGRFYGKHSELDTPLVVASVAKLSRPQHLAGVDPEHFDYVIVDEVHHAAAASYQRVLDHLQPRFLLGLTATPDRADEQDILGLFDDFEAFRADLPVGIERGDLVPFRYIGLRDPTDFAPIPWRSGRFSTEDLTKAVQTEARMQRLKEALAEHPGHRTLVFCCSIQHAVFVKGWLLKQGVRAAALYSGAGADDRDRALKELTDGELDAICAVDLLNEGVDVPTVDRVVMLRPTESPVVFLQQLGRGLRTAPNKALLTVLDFIGNHHVFLNRLRTLLSLSEEAGSLRRALQVDGDLKVELPEGCSVEIELGAVELLRELLPAGSRVSATMAFRDLRASLDRRPSASELLGEGVDARALKPSWFSFARDEGALSPAEAEALLSAEGWLTELQTTPMTKSYKMVVVQALLEADALKGGLSLEELAARSRTILVRSPELKAELVGKEAELADPERWLRYWNDWPVKAWTEGHGAAAAAGYFEVVGERLVSHLPWSESEAGQDALLAMTRELVALRLSEHRANKRVRSGVSLRVVRRGGELALRLPSGPERRRLPKGDALPLRLPDGQAARARLRTAHIDALHGPGETRNALPDLLRSWFGPQPVDAQVTLRLEATAWHLEPGASSETEGSSEPGELLAFPKRPPPPNRSWLPTYPTLRAAADTAGAPQAPTAEAERVSLPGDFGAGRFALRVSGDSMRGRAKPLNDGDWVVMRWARRATLEQLLSRVALFAIGDPAEGVSHHLKRLVRVDGGLALRSDNPAYPDIPVRGEVEPVALLERALSPSALAPTAGSYVEDLAEAFGLSVSPQAPRDRVDGHSFLLLDALPASLPAPGPSRPGETAYLLIREGDGWRYFGVARRSGSSWVPPSG